MKKVNLRDLYPDVYKNDHFVEVTEDVLETIRAAERAEAAYDRRMYRYKAHYSLDCDNGIENAILMKPQTPEMLLEEKQLRELGVDEDVIQRLHTYDWQQFKAERNFYEWQSFTDEDVEEIPETAARELKNIDDLLNSIENQKVLKS